MRETNTELNLRELKIFYTDLLKVITCEPIVVISDVKRVKHILLKLDNSLKELNILEKK